MTTGATLGEDLAGTDQAGSAGQSEVEIWKQKYAGLNGKLLTVQTQLVEAKSALQTAQERWEAEKAQLTGNAGQLKTELETTQTQLNDLVGKWGDVAAKLEQTTAQAARQQVLLKHPGLISDPVLKLVETSSLPASDLEATLAAMAQGQQQLVQTVYQEVQAGSTGPVAPPAAQGNAMKDQAQEAFLAATSAMSKGDMATYRTKYAEYIALVDKLGASNLRAPSTLTRPL